MRQSSYVFPGDSTPWPDAQDPASVERRLMFGTNAEKIQAARDAAAFVHAYRKLVLMPSRARTRKCAMIIAAGDAAEMRAAVELKERRRAVEW